MVLFEEYSDRHLYVPDEYWVETGVDPTLWILGSALFHGIIYIIFANGLSARIWPTVYTALKHKDRVEWDSRVVSNIHGAMSVAFSGYTMWVHGMVPPQPAGVTIVKAVYIFTISTLQHACVCWSVGYFVYDSVLITVHQHLLSAPLVIHHGIGVVIWTYAVWYQAGTIFSLWFIFTEISSFFVNGRWFMSKAGMRNSKVYIVNGFFMWFFFTFHRMPLEAYSAYAFWTDREALYNSDLFFFTSCGIALVGSIFFNTLWWYMISKGLWGVLTGTGSGKASKDE